MRTARRGLGTVAFAAAIALGAACLPGAGPPLNPYTDDAGQPPPSKLGDDASDLMDVNLGAAFAVTGLQPSEGPWTGGTRTTISGRGFSSNVAVSFGPTTLAASDVFASDPTQITVITPPGSPGAADVTVKDLSNAQQATLAAGFFYDSFAVTPGTGATTGGTRIALQGSGTHWTSGSTVTVAGKACTGVSFTDATHLACITPANDAGSEDVTVTNVDGSVDRAPDAFIYSDSPDGYRGGLYGGALSGTLTVLAFDNWTGTPISGEAIAGSNIATALTASFDSNGAAQFNDPSLQGKVTVTIVGVCHQPVTFVDVPVDTVTAYLNPTLDTACAMGDPPSQGNYVPTDDGEIDGELIWQGGIEFQKAAWGNVPMPTGAMQRQAAYVWTATGSPLDTLYLPPPSAATTPMSDGQLGYQYTLDASPGNQIIYALAGLEDDSTSPATFEPFAMGVARGVLVQPGAKTVGVDIPMTTLLDRTLTTVPQTPPLTARGPDRLRATFGVDLGAGSFVVFPQGTVTSLLPVSGDLSFVGVPSLDATLAGAAYSLTASAVTGTQGSTPTSVIAGIETTDANDPITLGGFFTVPTLTEPGSGTWSGTHLTLVASGPIDLATVTITSGGGLVAWSIVTPGSDLSFDLPDISQVQGTDSLVHGAISTDFAIARITGFDYGTVRYGQFSSSAWNAYAEDVANGSY
jgi:hypothetical protein